MKGVGAYGGEKRPRRSKVKAGRDPPAAGPGRREDIREGDAEGKERTAEPCAARLSRYRGAGGEDHLATPQPTVPRSGCHRRGPLLRPEDEGWLLRRRVVGSFVRAEWGQVVAGSKRHSEHALEAGSIRCLNNVIAVGYGPKQGLPA